MYRYMSDLPCTILHIKSFIKYLFTDSEIELYLASNVLVGAWFYNNAM